MIINSNKLVKCDNKVLEVVSFLEQKYGKVTINSGFRTPEDNKKCGGSVNSQHLTGLACDCHVPDVNCIKVAALILNTFPVRGIGLNVFGDYVHFDFRDSNNIIYWTYDRKGKAI